MKKKSKCYLSFSVNPKTVFDLHYFSERIQELEKRLIEPEFWQNIEATQISFQELSYSIFCKQQQYQEWLNLINEIKTGIELLNSGTSRELEWELITKFNTLSRELKHVEISQLLHQPLDDKGALVTITACNDDIDSQDWVHMLLRMYAEWCDDGRYNVGKTVIGYRNRHKISILNESMGEYGGFKCITMEISGKYAYGYLKSEQGVHKLQRIPPFSKDSKITTSFAYVEVIPTIDDSIDFGIPEKDLDIYLERNFGKRNFVNVNRPSVSAKVIHIPTGISVTSRDERNHSANLEKALFCLKSKIFALMQTQGVPLKDLKKPSPEIASEIAFRKLIREYTFHPEPKVKDLRTNVETSDIEEVMKGNPDLFIKAYLMKDYD